MEARPGSLLDEPLATVRRLPPTLAEVEAAARSLLRIDDMYVLHAALAGVVANYAQGDPIWMLLVGAPSTAKTEIVRALTHAPHVCPCGDLNARTLLSGARQSAGSPPPSLLHRIGEFGILTNKDLTTLLQSRACGQVFAQLREVHDGCYTRDLGTGEHLEWEGKLGLIAGVTPVVWDHHNILALMGERFVLARVPDANRQEAARWALARAGDEDGLRGAFARTVARFLAARENIGPLDLPDAIQRRAPVVADFATRARSGVSRDRWSRAITHKPEPEAPARFTKQLGLIGAAATNIGLSADAATRLIDRLAWDSVPPARRAVLGAVRAAPTDHRYIKGITDDTGLAETTVRRNVEDLLALGVVHLSRYGEVSLLPHSYWAV